MWGRLLTCLGRNPARRLALAGLWLATTGVLSAAGAVALASAGADPSAHLPGLRDQWQPQTEHDPRLQQPVQTEILGRAAVPALELLSRQTGVTLQVAPENLATVGERKLTICAQGCSLKSLMVQIPKALRECHWDAETTGPQPIYLLHRNGGTEAEIAQLIEEETRRRWEEGRPLREERVESARRALAMSPDDVAELAKSDPLLAAAPQDPAARKQIDLFLHLPSEAMEGFLATGNVTLSYASAPERFQRACRDMLQTHIQELEGNADWKRSQDDGGQSFLSHLAYGLHNPDSVVFAYENFDTPGGIGGGTRLWVRVFAPGGDEPDPACAVASAIPPLLPDWSAAPAYRDVLVKGEVADEDTVDGLLAELVQKNKEAQGEARARARSLQWREPRSAELHRAVTLPFKGSIDLADLQQYIAKETGLSIISDYFTIWGPRPIPPEAATEAPIWRLLYLLGDNWFSIYDWDEAGNCLTFHAQDWYRLILQELPESLVLACREKLRQRGGFSLDDALEVATALAHRGVTDAALAGDSVVVPEDLRRAGMAGPALTSGALLLYASLSAAQRAATESAEGLPYGAMTPAQRELVSRSAVEGADRRSLLPEQIAQAVFRSHIAVPAGDRVVYEFKVEFPGRTVTERLSLQRQRPATPGDGGCFLLDCGAGSAR